MTNSGETVHNVTYTYDELNRLTNVSDFGELEAEYTYDTNGNRASMTYANGAREEYTYNRANWVTGLVNTSGGSVLSSYAYTYYASGNQRSKTDHKGVVTGYVYDGLGRLTQESESTGLTVNYAYDAAGNRTQMAVSGAENYTTAYGYDENNRLKTETKTENGISATTTYFYDANGNLTKTVSPVGEVNNTYNGFDQLVFTYSGSSGTVYAYNAQGIRTAKVTADSVTSFLLDGGNVVGEVQDGVLSASYLRGVNLIRRIGAEGMEYYLFNAHGDVVALTDGFGTLTKSYDYDAFGKEKSPDSADSNPFRYCGEYFDTETGTYYLRARYYDPEIGRFTQQDPHWSPANAIYGDNPRKINQRQDALGLTTYAYAPEISAIMQSGNLYVYAINNPIVYCDLTGKVVTPANIIGAIIGAGGGALLGTLVANYYGLEGWRRSAAIAGFTVGGAALGWFVGSAVQSAISHVVVSAITSGKLALTSLSSGIVSALNLGQQAAQNTINKISGSTQLIPHLTKHLASAGGKYAKFYTDSATVINSLLAKALRIASNFSVNSHDSFVTIVDMGQVVGLKGETMIKIVFSLSGDIITAFPAK